MHLSHHPSCWFPLQLTNRTKGRIIVEINDYIKESALSISTGYVAGDAMACACHVTPNYLPNHRTHPPHPGQEQPHIGWGSLLLLSPGRLVQPRGSLDKVQPWTVSRTYCHEPVTNSNTTRGFPTTTPREPRSLHRRSLESRDPQWAAQGLFTISNMDIPSSEVKQSTTCPCIRLSGWQLVTRLAKIPIKTRW